MMLIKIFFFFIACVFVSKHLLMIFLIIEHISFMSLIWSMKHTWLSSMQDYWRDSGQ